MEGLSFPEGKQKNGFREKRRSGEEATRREERGNCSQVVKRKKDKFSFKCF